MLSNTVQCQICNKEFLQITTPHLKNHGISMKEYKLKFPNAQTISDQILDTIKIKSLKRIRTEEHCKNLSLSKKGKKPNHNGTSGMKFTQDPEKVKARALKRKENNRKKLGLTDDMIKQIINEYQTNDIEITRLAEKYNIKPPIHISNILKENNILVKRKMSDFYRKQMSNRKLGNVTYIRTDQHKKELSERRIAYMQNNKGNFKDTLGELKIKEYLINKNIEFVQQFRIKGYKHVYDFYLPKYNLIIEFDGAHHWLKPWFGVKGKTENEIKMILDLQIQKDKKDSDFAISKGFNIVRIIGKNYPGDVTPTIEEQLMIKQIKFDL